MLASIGVILLFGIVLGKLCKKIKLPELIGYLISGLIIGPYCLNLIDSGVLTISSEIRQMALIVILLRSGLSIDLTNLKKVGKSAILLSFVPALFEMFAYSILGQIFFKLSLIDSLILGSVIAAVSPAVIVPRMLDLIKNNYGKKKNIPLMLMASSSVDDIFVIMIFTSLTSLSGASINITSLLVMLISMASALIIGIIIGKIISFIYQNIELNKTAKFMILILTSFMIVGYETNINTLFPFSALLAVMVVGACVDINDKNSSKQLSDTLSHVWQIAQIFLFTLVAAIVDLKVVIDLFVVAVIVIFIALFVRMIGVYFCLFKTNLNNKEKLFSAIAFCPKATVQASLATIPLAMGLPCGEIVLIMGFTSIITTAPIFAFIIDSTYKKLLVKDK